MRGIGIWGVPAVAAALWCGAAAGQDPQDEPPPREVDRGPLVVAVREAPPFAMKDAAGRWTGLSVELWDEMAGRLDVEFEWRDVDLAATLDGLAAGELDVAVAALTITGERERRIDFSHPYYVSGLALGHAGSQRSAWLAVVRNFLSLEFLSAVGTLAAVLLVAGFAVWLFERKANDEEFGGGVKGLGDGFWWSAVTMTTVGYGDKAPKTVGGRVVALVWMFASLIIIAGFTASIAASLTAETLGANPLRGRALSELTVAVVEGSSADAFAGTRGAIVQRHDDLDGALGAVETGTAEVVLHDAPILKHRVREGADWLTVAPQVLVRDDYGFGMPPGSELREEMDVTLLSILHEPLWQRLRARYLGEDGDNRGGS